MQLVDTHVHLNFDCFAAELDTVADQWRQAGVTRLVHSCVTPQEFPQLQAVADRFPEVSLAVGLHPLDVELWQDETAAEIEQLARSDQRVVAIGETGLDFFKSEDHERQYAAVEAQLAIARSLDLPVILHCREAAEAMATVLRSQQSLPGTLRGVMHCWGGTPEETRWFLDLGFHISFSGTLTFGKAETIRDSARLVPSDRLLIETDCPFLAPVPKRGKRNEPAFVQHVAARMAEVRSESLDAIAAATTRNAFDLFRLPAVLPELA